MTMITGTLMMMVVVVTMMKTATVAGKLCIFLEIPSNIKYF